MDDIFNCAAADSVDYFQAVSSSAQCLIEQFFQGDSCFFPIHSMQVDAERSLAS